MHKATKCKDCHSCVVPCGRTCVWDVDKEDALIAWVNDYIED